MLNESLVFDMIALSSGIRFSLLLLNIEWAILSGRIQFDVFLLNKRVGQLAEIIDEVVGFYLKDNSPVSDNLSYSFSP